MRYKKIRFHHVPGHEHDHPHGHDHGHCHEHDHAHAAAAAPTKEQTIQLLEYLRHHNEDHALELADYQNGVEDSTAIDLLAESVMFLNKSNERLGEAIAVLKGE